MNDQQLQIRNWRAQGVTSLVQFWQWWTGELIGLIPQRWRRHLQGRECVLVYEAGHFVYREASQSVSIPLEQATQHPLFATWRTLAQRGELVVTLPDSELLHKVIALPAAVENRLGAALGFELDRHTPFSASEAGYGYRILQRDRAGQRIEVELYVLPDTKRQRILEALAGAGLTPHWLLPAQSVNDQANRRTLDLLPDSQRVSRRHVTRIGGPILALLALAVLIGALFYQRDQRIQSLEAEVAGQESVAEQARRLRADIEALEAGGSYIRNLKHAEPPLMVLLDELTRLLPDHTWLSRFEYQKQELRIQGESSSASELLGMLEQSALFEQVEFSSPVTINPRSRKERFSLTLRVVQGAQP